MTRAFSQSGRCVPAVLLMALLCPGCVGRHAYTKQQFVLTASRPAPPAGPGREAVLAVRGFTADPVYDSRSLLYRKGESEYQADFYREFLIAPQALISSQTRNWLAQSGVCKTVLEPGSLIEPTHVLEGNVLALYGDLREPGLPQAVMQIRVFLLAGKGSRPEIVFTRDYQASSRARERTAEALVAAQNQCLTQVLSELEKDLGGVL
jgi:cholesterol transport system auxiliary component